jgi:multidrug efflux system membrane fusion protein
MTRHHPPADRGAALGAALAAALAAAPWATGCSGTEPAAARTARPVPVRVATAVEKAVPLEVRATGRVVSAATVAVRAQVSGQIVAARFTEGQPVRKGDVLVEIDRRPAEAALAEARANLARDEARAGNAREDAARLGQLAEKEFVTRQQAEAAAANAAALIASLDAARAAVRRAELNLEWCTVRAPISGRTGRLLVQPGNLVVAGAADLVTIEQVKPVWASFAIPARHLPALRARATPATALVRPEGGAEDLPATVEFVDNAVDAGTGTVLLKARLPNEDEALWPGQVVEVRLRLSEGSRSVVVPSGAVAAGQQGDYVWVVKDGAGELRPISVAQAGERETVVANGLAAGEQVVIEGQLKLVPGARVEPLPAAGEAAR